MDNNLVGGIEQEKAIKQAESSIVSGEIVVPIGTMTDRKLFIQDLSVIPHFLICGCTGSGKTSFVQTITTLIATKYSPEKVKYIIYDSKMVDYVVYAAMPHLLFPVIFDWRKANATLAWTVSEIRNRLMLFAKCSAKNIATYNANCKINGVNALSHIFIILDDFSSLILNDNTNLPLMDILTNGRPAGIHMVLITSLTSSKVLTREILSNLSCRISFRVSNRANSRIAIDQNGAEGLCLPGELFFKWQNKLIKCQGSYMPDEDIAKKIKQLQRQSKKSISTLGTMAEQIFEPPVISSDELTTDDEENSLFFKAVEQVIEAGQASTSLLQRRLRLGYARSERLINEMEQFGIIGPREGSKPRQVLITYDTWQKIRNKYSI